MSALAKECERLASQAFAKDKLAAKLGALSANPNATYADYAAAAASVLPPDTSIKRELQSFQQGVIEFTNECNSPVASGIPTGFIAYDHLTNGLHAGDLTIIGARPGVGKTSLAVSIGVNVSKAGNGVALFSMEMPTTQVIARAICSEARVDLLKVRAKSFTAEEQYRIIKASGRNSKLPFFVDDTATIRVHEIAAKVKAKQADTPINVVILDYLQLIKGDSASPQFREQDVSMISRGLKAMAKELNVAVIALSQLNRGIENREDKKPRLSDLRESGAIEQDADNIAFIHRTEQHGASADIILAKQRNGPTGIVSVGFEEQYTRFCNLHGGEQ